MGEECVLFRLSGENKIRDKGGVFMNVNEIVTRLQEIDLSMLLFQNGENSRVLSINEMIVLAVLAAAGVLICLLGLKIVRFWAAVLGLLAGFAGGFSVAGMFGVEPMVSLIIGLAAGVILAVLGAVLYRVGVFLTVFLTVGAFCISILNPQDWIFLGICLGIALAAAILSIWLAVGVTIIATSLFGAILFGNALGVLVPAVGTQDIIRIAVIAAVCVLGIIVQLLFESRKRKRRNLKKAAEIREQESTENEVERARAMFEDSEGPEEEPEEEIPHDEDETFISLDEFEDDLDEEDDLNDEIIPDEEDDLNDEIIPDEEDDLDNEIIPDAGDDQEEEDKHED